MTDFLTDDEKADAIKNWLKVNGMSIIVGVSLAVTGLLAYRYWQDHTVNQAQIASSIYANIQQEALKPEAKTADAVKATDTSSDIQQLKTNYADTPYASLAALLAAKRYALKGDNATAIKELQWVVDNASEKLVQDLAKLRLSRIYIASKQLDKASALLAQTFSSAYASLISELKGDIHLAKSQPQKARAAYDKALLSAQGMPTDYLKMKRDDLGSAPEQKTGS
jgi:predicted negative regulator of RcsB-dependent stress response